eukprot:188357_1
MSDSSSDENLFDMVSLSDDGHDMVSNNRHNNTNEQVSDDGHNMVSDDGHDGANEQVSNNRHDMVSNNRHNNTNEQVSDDGHNMVSDDGHNNTNEQMSDDGHAVYEKEKEHDEEVRKALKKVDLKVVGSTAGDMFDVIGSKGHKQKPDHVRKFILKKGIMDSIENGEKTWETRAINLIKYTTVFVGMTLEFKQKVGGRMSVYHTTI